MKDRVVVAMSGGVDSSVAAALLLREGYEVIGLHLVLWPHCSGRSRKGVCCGPEALEDSMRVAEALGIRFHVEDISDLFQRQVIDYFVDEYRKGRTPNPCVICNRYIKFNTLIRKAGEFGAELVSTGHYARISKDGRYRLLRAIDKKYDQTYFLSYLTQDQLSRALFPVGELEKERTREIASEMGLGVHDRRSSHDVCFIQDRGYGEFLREKYPELLNRGDVLDTSGKRLGEHNGIAFYTVGQRHGLGIGGSKPFYVISIDRSRRTLVLGDERDLYKDGMVVDKCNWIAFEEPSECMDCTVKTRYSHAGAEARITCKGGEKVEVMFKKPQRAIAPGQVAVFYSGEETIGGGFIENSFYL